MPQFVVKTLKRHSGAAGFIDIHELNGTISAPVPTISWLRKF